MFTWADGQLAAAAATIFTQGQVPAALSGITGPGGLGGYYSIALLNTSASTETCSLYVQRGSAGSTTNRLLFHPVLGQNESALITGVVLGPGDIIQAVATDATAVNYMVSDSPPGVLTMTTYDSNGAIKQTNGSSITGATTITSTSANALAVGPNGATNPTLNVTGNVSSEAGGLNVTGGADAVGVALAAIGSNTNEPLKLDGKGAGLISIGTVSTGGAVIRTKVATVAAANNAISNATLVGEGFYYVTGANGAGNNACLLPASVAGKQVTVKNTVANAVLVIFPPVSSQINANGVNNAYNIAAGAIRTFTCVTTTLWYAAPETIA
jgi:hypothetical protein